MDLSTTYLGFNLPHPIMPGASPLAHDIDMVRRLEDAGAAAIVMHSLFEEQIEQDQMVYLHSTEDTAESFSEAREYFPHHNDYAFGPEAYLEQIRLIKDSVSVPVIASLNGITHAGWIDNSRLIEEAGADALEINVYFVAADPDDTGQEVEDRLIAIGTEVKEAVQIPVAVKLSPFFSGLAHLVQRLEGLGLDGLVLFNRFYQPDIDIEGLDVSPSITLSTSAELRLRLRWLAILSAQTELSLAASGGIHTVTDAIKAIMTGAHAVQMVSRLLKSGPERLGEIVTSLNNWLVDHEYESLKQMQGSMDLSHSPHPVAFERASYLRMLHGWRKEYLPPDAMMD